MVEILQPFGCIKRCQQHSKLYIYIYLLIPINWCRISAMDRSECAANLQQIPKHQTKKRNLAPHLPRHNPLLRSCCSSVGHTTDWPGLFGHVLSKYIGNVALPFQGSVFNKLDPPVPSAQVGQDPTVHEAHVWEGWVGWVEMCNFHAKRLQKRQRLHQQKRHVWSRLGGMGRVGWKMQFSCKKAAKRLEGMGRVGWNVQFSCKKAAKDTAV